MGRGRGRCRCQAKGDRESERGSDQVLKTSTTIADTAFLGNAFQSLMVRGKKDCCL